MTAWREAEVVLGQKIFFYARNMSRPPPPLNALRALEATARLGSFTKAAEELGVTSAAVGQQVRSLEAFLNLTLFHRSAGGLEQTWRVREALPVLRGAFDQIAEAVRMLDRAPDGARLRITVPPNFGANWLAPRLASFHARHPDIELNVDASPLARNLARGEADLALRFGAGRYAGLVSERILDEHILPLCSPRIRDRYQLRRLRDLGRAPLVHLADQTADKSWPSWRDWAECNALSTENLTEGPTFGRSAIAMAMKAVTGDQGVILAGLVYAMDDIATGRIVAPFGGEGAVPMNYGYDLVYSAALAETRPVAAFRAWAKAEGRKTRRAMARILQRSPSAAE